MLAQLILKILKSNTKTTTILSILTTYQSLLDGIPNFGHRYHHGGRKMFQGSLGISTGGRQTLGVRITDANSLRHHDKFRHQFHNVGHGQVSQIHILGFLNAQFDITRRTSAHNTTVGNDNSLGLSSGT